MLFTEEAGRIYLANSFMEALREAKLAFVGEAERAELETEEDVVALISRHKVCILYGVERGKWF